MSREDLQRENIVRIFQLSNSLQTYIDRLLKENDLTAKQFFMMIIIGSFEYEPGIGEVSDRFGTSRQNVKQVLNKLVANGYLVLYKDENDQRVLRVRFTEKALTFWNDRTDEDDKTIKTIFESLTIDELSGLLNGLLKVMKKIEEMSI